MVTYILYKNTHQRGLSHIVKDEEWYISQNGASGKVYVLWSPAALCSTTYNMCELGLVT